MKRTWVYGMVAGLHVAAAASFLAIQGCRTSTGAPGAKPAGPAVVMPPTHAPESPVVIRPKPIPEVTSWPPADTTGYVVQRGDTLSGIAARHGISARELARLNGIENPNMVRVGQRLQIPSRTDAPVAAPPPQRPAVPDSARVYEVQRGDSLSVIAANLGTTTKALMEANALTSDRILVGQKLVIPDGARAPAAGTKPTPRPAAAQPASTTDPLLGLPPIEAPEPAPDVSDDGAAVDAPAPTVMREHIVTAREDLPRVAMMYNVSVNRLKAVNRLGPDDTIRPGQKLLIPISE